MTRGLDVGIEVDTMHGGNITGVEFKVFLEHTLESNRLEDETLSIARNVFARSEHYDQYILPIIDEPQSVIVIVGQPGSGRTITALVLLAELRNRSITNVHSISYGGSKRFPVGRLPRIQNAAYLLELPSDDEAAEENLVSSDFGVILESAKRILSPLTARLIVITTPDQWRRIKFGFSGPVGFVKPAPAAAIARSWLAREIGNDLADRWVADTAISGLLQAQEPTDAMDIVEIIRTAVRVPIESLTRSNEIVKRPSLDPARDHDDFDLRVASVLAARRNWREELLDWHKRLGRTSFERNFMLVTAAQPGSYIGELYAGAQLLAGLFGEPEQALVGQQAPGVLELLNAIGADLSDDDTARFLKPGWDDAVLDYFRIDRPLCQDAFLDWMARIPLEMPKDTGAAETPSRTDRAHRMANLTLRWAERHRHPEYLDRILTRWFDQNDLWPKAIEALTECCFRPTIARKTHQILLRWARQARNADQRGSTTVPRGPMVLQRAVLDVCAGQFSKAYAGKALVRIRHIASSVFDDNRVAFERTIRTLWHDETVRADLTNDMITWCGSPDLVRRDAGRRIFLSVAAITKYEVPTLLHSATSGDSEIEDQLVTGWRTAYSAEAHRIAEADKVLFLWLNSCVEDKQYQAMFLSILRRAATMPNSGLANLRHQFSDAVYRWQPPPDSIDDPDIQQRVNLRYRILDAFAQDDQQALRVGIHDTTGSHDFSDAPPRGQADA